MTNIVNLNGTILNLDRLVAGQKINGTAYLLHLTTETGIRGVYLRGDAAKNFDDLTRPPILEIGIIGADDKKGRTK